MTQPKVAASAVWSPRQVTPVAEDTRNLCTCRTLSFRDGEQESSAAHFQDKGMQETCSVPTPLEVCGTGCTWPASVSALSLHLLTWGWSSVSSAKVSSGQARRGKKARPLPPSAVHFAYLQRIRCKGIVKTSCDSSASCCQAFFVTDRT